MIPPDNGEQTVQISVSEPAHDWATQVMGNSDHGWHGMVCPTCANRYMTLTIAFDAGFKYGTDHGESKPPSAIIIPGA